MEERSIGLQFFIAVALSVSISPIMLPTILPILPVQALCDDAELEGDGSKDAITVAGSTPFPAWWARLRGA
jgi:hypothetical protein